MHEPRHEADALETMRRRASAAPRNAVSQCELGLALARAGNEAEAIPWLQRALSLDTKLLPAWRALAEALRSVGREGDALLVLERATTVLPKSAELHLRHGDLLHAQNNRSQARQCYKQGARVERNTTLGRICQAKALNCDQRFSEAAQVLRHALARDPCNLAANNLLGEVLGYLGRLNEAAALYERTLERMPERPWTGWYGLTRSRKIVAADRPMLENVERLLPGAGLPQSVRQQIEFALGKAYDDLGEYERAMPHFDAANQIRRIMRPFDRSRFLAAIEMVISCFTPRFFADRAALASVDETPVLIVGMPRSGTTLVEQILSSHPRAAGAGELTFWAAQTNAMSPAAVQAMDGAKAHAIAAEYLAQLRRHGEKALRITDKNPFNFFWIGFFRLIFPNATIVHCRRNPIDTCLSNYVTDFEMNWGFNSDRDDLVFVYRQYRRLMAYWSDVLPQARLVEVDYERLTGDPETEARRLIAGVGLDWDEACLRPERNERLVQTASVWQVRQPVYRTSVRRWRHYEPWLGSLRELEER